MNEKLTNEQLMARIPQPAGGSVFALERVHDVVHPHPYCIGPRHVAEAADHFGGILGDEAIRSAEKKGARCDICRQQHLNLSYDDHEHLKLLMVAVPSEYQRNLNACPGLHAYLLSIKELAGELGITGFGFPTLEQSNVKRVQ